MFLRAEEIDWIEAAGNYLKIHAGAETHLHRETMNTMQERLGTDHFARIHRSTIVNLVHQSHGRHGRGTPARNPVDGRARQMLESRH